MAADLPEARDVRAKRRIEFQIIPIAPVNKAEPAGWDSALPAIFDQTHPKTDDYKFVRSSAR